MRGFIVGTIVTAIAFYVLTKVLPEYTSFDIVTYEGELIGIVVLAADLRRGQRLDRADRHGCSRCRSRS